MKKTLIIVPFDQIFPPTNGGMQRFFHIIHQLAKHTELTLITKQEKNEFLKAIKDYPSLTKTNVLSTKDASIPKDLFSLFPRRVQNALRYRWYKRNIKGPADGNYLAYYPVLRKQLQNEKFDFIVLESPATLNAVGLIRKYDKKVKIIFDAHNVNTNLDASFLQKNEITKARYLQTKHSESNLYKTVNAILVCSRKDRDDFDRLNNGKLSISIIPNGVEVLPKMYDEGVRSGHPCYLLFCGYLSSKPNREGLLWFYRSIWPEIRAVFPELKLLIVGSGELPLEMKKLITDPTVSFTGKVNDVKPFYNRSSLSIVPLKTGSGTRLKILEAMSYGVPVVSTYQGAEGIEYTDGVDIMIADDEKLFAENVIQLLSNKEKRLLIQENGRQLVERKYDWNIIGNALSEFLNRN